jgi:hypothetical protein
MKQNLEAKNCRLVVIDHPQDDCVLLNIHHHRDLSDGEHLQMVLPRYVAKALGHILLKEED